MRGVGRARKPGWLLTVTEGAQVFRLKGHGLPVSGRSSRIGDLYATVGVEIPKDLTPAQREHYEALAAIDGGTPAE